MSPLGGNAKPRPWPPADHYARMKAAKARAEWELGDASWADVIVGAYLHPDYDAEALALEKAEALALEKAATDAS